MKAVYVERQRVLLSLHKIGCIMVSVCKTTDEYAFTLYECEIRKVFNGVPRRFVMQRSCRHNDVCSASDARRKAFVVAKTARKCNDDVWYGRIVMASNGVQYVTPESTWLQHPSTKEWYYSLMAMPKAETLRGWKG